MKQFFKIIIIALAILCSFPQLSDAKVKKTQRKTKTAEKQYVDLGLPSGTLWATMNVGANKPEDYGDYFAWGETKPKDNYRWSTYKWYNASSDKITKYIPKSNRYGNADNKSELEPTDDAAYVNWGPSWRMPSMEQMRELISECTWQWTTQNGVNGYLVSSKSNSNTLFLPAAGFRFGTIIKDTKTDGNYWVRKADPNYPYVNAFYLNFNSKSIDMDYYFDRSYGRNVRAVRAKK